MRTTLGHRALHTSTLATLWPKSATGEGNGTIAQDAIRVMSMLNQIALHLLWQCMHHNTLPQTHTHTHAPHRLYSL